MNKEIKPSLACGSDIIELGGGRGEGIFYAIAVISIFICEYFLIFIEAIKK